MYPPAVRDSGPHMAIMEGIDLEIQSWFVDASEIEFCRRPDGSDWLLGEGSYGKVRGSGLPKGSCWPSGVALPPCAARLLCPLDPAFSRTRPAAPPHSSAEAVCHVQAHRLGS